MATTGIPPSRVVCLLPARNAAHLLDHWFASVGQVADTVVALDDGSTDDTTSILEAHPMVAAVLRNSRREGYAGWNDSENRSRLLAAAADLDPDWIISIDADERLAPGDAAALSRFIDEQALPGLAYGFPTHRMIDDLDRHDGIESRSYRLFAFDPTHRFPTDRLHFEPVPTAIPRGRWLCTDIRIQHLGTMTPELRQARKQKYAEADPGRHWEEDYDYIHADPGQIRPWRERPPHQPVLLSARYRDGTLTEADLTWPVLSVVLIVDHGTVDEMAHFWSTTVAAADDRAEVLVIAENNAVADDLARLCPGATVVSEPGGSSGAEARNVGLRVARGDYVVCLDAPADVAPGGWGALIEIHDRGNAVVRYPCVNDTYSAPGWASWARAPDRCSFAREILTATGGFAETLGRWADHEARLRLVDAGHRVGHNPLLTGHHRTDLAESGDFLARCRDLGRRRVQLSRGVSPWRLARADLGRYRASAGQLDPGEYEDAVRRVRPLVAAGLVISWAGAATESFAHRRKTLTDRRWRP